MHPTDSGKCWIVVSLITVITLQGRLTAQSSFCVSHSLLDNISQLHVTWELNFNMSCDKKTK